MEYDRKRVLLLVNSVSGTKNAVSQLFDTVRYLTLYHCLVTVFPIVPAQGLVSERIPPILKDGAFDVIACCGGDGTLNHLVNVLVKNGIDLPVGYIPSGSTNDFSRSLNRGRTLTLEDQCMAIAGGSLFSYDIGKVNDLYFNYIAAFGAFTRVSYDTPQKWKNTFGYGAYMLNILSSIPEGISYRRHVRYEYDGGVGEGDFIFGSVSNTLSVAGVMSPLVSQAKLDDGLFEVILIRAPKNIGDLNLIVQKLSSGSADDSHVIKFSASRIRFFFEESVQWTLDGEAYSTEKEVIIENCRQAVSLCVLK